MVKEEYINSYGNLDVNSINLKVEQRLGYQVHRKFLVRMSRSWYCCRNGICLIPHFVVIMGWRNWSFCWL